MRNVIIGLIFNAFAAAEQAAGTPPTLTLAQLFDFCESQTIAEAEAKGGRLGWRRMADAELEDWRAGFISYSGGSVEVLGWRRGEKDDDESLSFWVARGADGHRVCAYSAANPAGLLGDLSERFGSPANIDKYELGTTASWKLGQMEVSFSQVGSAAVVYIAHDD